MKWFMLLSLVVVASCRPQIVRNPTITSDELDQQKSLQALRRGSFSRNGDSQTFEKIEALNRDASESLSFSQVSSELFSPASQRFSPENIIIRAPDKEAVILQQDSVSPTADGHSGSFFETSNGIRMVQSTRPDEDGYSVVRGAYSYISPEGKEISVVYVADRNGFQVLSEPDPSLPAHALEQIRRGKEEYRRAALLRAALKDA